MELVCPAGNYQSLIKAVENGADAVYLGLKNETNARHFAGLNFNQEQIISGIEFAHKHQCKVFCAINTFPTQSGWRQWRDSIDLVVELGVDSLILADLGVLDYTSNRYPSFPIHLSVQASATNIEALNFYYQNFGIRRAVLPRVLSLQQVQQLAAVSPVDLEVFGFGSLCIMVEGRCYLSSYLTGDSPNTKGVCSPAKYVSWLDNGEILESRLNGLLIDRFSENENAGYPTLCKGRFNVGDKVQHVLEEPTSLNTMNILPELHRAGITAIKIEGRQRSPAYIAKVTKAWRQALDSVLADKVVDSQLYQQLLECSEGKNATIGAYERTWQ